MSANAARNVYRLYVANIPWTVSNKELRSYFSKFGVVSSAVVIFDKKTGLSKNYGFVLFGNKKSYEDANNFTEHHLEGNNLKVQPSSN